MADPIKDGLVYLSETQDLIDLHDFMQDDDFLEAMELALKCIAKPDIPPAVARNALMKMQGFAFKFKMQALVYMQIHTGKAGTTENIKKNAYMYASEQCDKMAQTLKYLAKERFGD